MSRPTTPDLIQALVDEAYADLPYDYDSATRPIVAVQVNNSVVYVDTTFVQDCGSIGIAVDHIGFGDFKVADGRAARLTDESRDRTVKALREAGYDLPKGWPSGRLHSLTGWWQSRLVVACQKAGRTLLWIDKPTKPLTWVDEPEIT